MRSKGSIAIVLAGSIAFEVFSPSPASAQGCKQWDTTGRWAAIQNNNLNPVFNVQQSGAKFSGSALLNIFGTTRVETQTGTLTGDMIGNNFFAVVQWRGTRGIYEGTIRSEGVITGITFDERNPSARIGWRSQRAMKCLTSASSPTTQPVPTSKQPKPVTEPTADKLKPKTGSSGVAAIRSALTACKTGYVWRVARPDDLVCVTPESRSRVAGENQTASSRVQPGGGPNCRSGFVWREAFSGDTVCVTPVIRAAVREENRLGPSRRVQQ